MFMAFRRFIKGVGSEKFGMPLEAPQNKLFGGMFRENSRDIPEIRGVPKSFGKKGVCLCVSMCVCVFLLHS